MRDSSQKQYGEWQIRILKIQDTSIQLIYDNNNCENFLNSKWNCERILAPCKWLRWSHYTGIKSCCYATVSLRCSLSTVIWLGHPHASRESEVLIEFKSLNNPVGAAQLWWSSSSPQIQFPMKLTGSAFLYLFIVQPPPPFPNSKHGGIGGDSQRCLY